MALAGEVLDRSKVVSAHIEIPTADGSIEAFLARPQSEGVRPGIIVIHEAFGPVEHIYDVARRFANIGYDVVAPNLYSREGQPPLDDMQILIQKMFGVPDSRAVSDLEASARYLRELDSANGKVGSIGFCSGGRHSLLFACSSRDVDAAVDCWGGQIEKATMDELTTELRPVTVVDLLANVACPVLVIGGVEDENPSPAVLADVEKRLEGKDARVEIFDGAGHAFFADYRPSYREGPAFKLWDMVTEFFEAKL